MRLLFIAPTTNLAHGAELSRVASGMTIEVIDGLLDRAGLGRALREAEADIVHFCGHGGKSVLELGDGLLDKGDLVSMLSGLRAAKVFVINACEAASLGIAIHNALHVPVIAMDAEIDDRAAVRFAESFYRAYRASGSVGGAFDTARDTLLRVHPDQASAPVLINGDMATGAALEECMAYVKTQLGELRAQLAGIEGNVKEMKTQQPHFTRHMLRFGYMALALLVLLVVAQAATPWLNAVFAR